MSTGRIFLIKSHWLLIGFRSGIATGILIGVFVTGLLYPIGTAFGLW